MASSILRVLMCCWLLISQTGIDTSSCQAAVVTPSTHKTVDHHEPAPEQVEKQSTAPKILIVNGLGQVIQDDSVCSSGTQRNIRKKTLIVNKVGCHCSLAKKLAGKCCCSLSTISEDGDNSQQRPSSNPCGEIVGGGCQCADEVGTIMVLRVPTVLNGTPGIIQGFGPDIVIVMADDEVCEASLEPAVDPPELG